VAEPNLVVIRSVNGKLEANILKLFLESQGLHPILIGESLGDVYGLQFTPLGIVDIFVLEEEVKEARMVLDRMDRGDFEQDSDNQPDDASSQAQ
jgi:hypothetical protein